ncbi:MAG: VWA domain-containing protein [Candidatus Saccharimonadales bacterium]
MASQFGPLTLLGGIASAATAPAANPALSQACGLDIAIVIDNSLSISSSEMTDFKNALKSFTNALSGTPTQFSVTKFNTSATVLQNFTSNVTTVNSAIDSVSTSSGYTNWEDALIKANSTFSSGTSNPNLVIFATDGDPTTSNTVGGLDTNQPNAHLDPAIIAANTIKNGGTRMLALGIGITGSSLDRLKSISGPSANTGDVITSDVITTSNFSTLATNLATFASQTCGGTITTTKYIDADGNLNTTNDQTLAGAGWTFDINGGSNPAATQTDATGKTPAVKVEAASGYSVNETQKTGYTLLSASCTGAATNGSKNGDAVTGIQIAANNIVSCKFINTATKGTLTVNKVVNNTHGGTKKAADFAFIVDGTQYSFVNTTGNNGSKSVTLPTGTYTVTEVNPNTGGYEMTGNTCTNVVVSYNQTTTCTITNSDVAPKLIVKKHVVNDNGGSKVAANFTMNVTGTNVSNASFAGDENGTTVTLNPGSYSVNENADNAYTKSLGTDCSGTIALGETKTCIVTNDDKAPALTLIKNLIKDNGGTANATDWTLKATGALASPTNLSGATGSAGATSGSNFKADTYTLSETGGPSGYISQGWSCTNGVTVSPNSTITLVNGQSTICTVTNNDDTPALTLVKKLGETYGSNVNVSAWTLTATGTLNPATNISGKTGTPQATSGSNFKADTYTLGESGPSGFTASWSCKNNVTGAIATVTAPLAIALGQNYTCTATNTGIQPKLTVKKVVDNGNTGGDKVSSNFTMNVSGSSVINPSFAGSTNGTTTGLNVGPYKVTEGSHTGYNDSYSADCDSSINLGETKTCTVTNTAIAPTLKLVKKAINDNGGTKLANTFTLTAANQNYTGTSLASNSGGVSVTNPYTVTGVKAGAANKVTISETPASGYTLTSIVCKNSDDAVVASNTYQTSLVLTLDLAQNITCTVTNDDNTAALTLIKKLGENLYGANAKASDWTVAANGPGNSDISGLGTATGNTLSAGSYTLSETSKVWAKDAFMASDWSCVNNKTNEKSTVESTLALVLGADYTCTITNTAVQPKLTVKKIVDNDKTGGTAKPSDFMMYVKGSKVTNPKFAGSKDGVTTGLNVGKYEVTEGNHDGYAVKYSKDCEGTISLGDTKTCTITNTAIAPTLTLKKVVINNNSGESSPKDWTLTATPANEDDEEEDDVWAKTISGNGQDGVKNVKAKANVTYTLSESGPTDYTAGNWSCNGNENRLKNGKLTLNLGENVTCTITNNDNQHPGLEVFKSGPATAHEGDVVTYYFEVYNAGDTSLSNVVLTDDVIGSIACPKTLLAKGESMSCTATYKIPSPQVSDVTNIATACGTYYADSWWSWNSDKRISSFEHHDEDNDGTRICATDDHTLDVLHPSIKVVKTGPATAKVGDVVTYTFTVTNTGDEPLDSVTVADNIAGKGVYKSGDTNNDSKLDVSETWIYTANYTIPSGSEGTSIVNTVKTCGSEPQSEEVNPELSILKIESEAIQLPKNDVVTVCSTDTHTTTVEKPQVLVDTGSGSLTALGYILVITMLGGAFAVSRRR